MQGLPKITFYHVLLWLETRRATRSPGKSTRLSEAGGYKNFKRLSFHFHDVPQTFAVVMSVCSLIVEHHHHLLSHKHVFTILDDVCVATWAQSMSTSSSRRISRNGQRASFVYQCLSHLAHNLHHLAALANSSSAPMSSLKLSRSGTFDTCSRDNHTL